MPITRSPKASPLAAVLLACATTLAWAEEPILESAPLEGSGETVETQDAPPAERRVNLTGFPQYDEEPVTRAPVTVTVLDEEDLRDPGARFLTAVFRKVPGINVLRTTSTSSDVSARGFNEITTTSQGMLTLIDGRSGYNEWLGNVLWDALPVSLAGIERIEIIRGPGSFLYGPNAMHGFIDIRTRSPLDYGEGLADFSVGAGSYDSSTASATIVRRKDDVGLKATLGWDDIAPFESGGSGSSSKKFMELRFGKDAGELHRVEVTGGASEQGLELIVPAVLGLQSANVANAIQETFLKINYTRGGLERPTDRGERGRFAAQVYWTGFEADVQPEEVYGAFLLDSDTMDLDLQYSRLLGARHELSFGAGYRYATFETKTEGVADGRHSTNLSWAFFQERASFKDDSIFLTAGFRVDQHSISGTNISPRAALVWAFDRAFDEYGELVRERSFRASAGFGFRNPSLRETWSAWPVDLGPVVGIVAGNTDLEAEKMRSLELGYNASLRRTSFAASVFLNRIDDGIEYEPDGLMLVPKNQSDEEAYGFEAEAEYRFKAGGDRVSCFGNYSHVNRTHRDTNDRVRDAPRHVASLGLRLAPPGWRRTALADRDERRPERGFSGMVWANYVDAIEVEGVPVDAYVFLSGELSYLLPIGSSRGRLFVQGTNLLEDHREHPDGQSYGAIVLTGLRLTW